MRKALKYMVLLLAVILTISSNSMIKAQTNRKSEEIIGNVFKFPNPTLIQILEAGDKVDNFKQISTSRYSIDIHNHTILIDMYEQDLVLAANVAINTNADYQKINELNSTIKGVKVILQQGGISIIRTVYFQEGIKFGNFAFQISQFRRKIASVEENL